MWKARASEWCWSHTQMQQVSKEELCSGKLAEGTEINIGNCSAVKWQEISGAVPGARIHFGRMCWKQTLLWGLTGWCAPAWRIPALSLTNAKDFLELKGFCRPQPLLGWSALSQDCGCLGLEQSRVSASGVLLHTSVCGQTILGSPVVVCLDVWAGTLSGGASLVLQDVALPGQDTLCQLPFPGVAAKAPEQLLSVNSLVFWQFCRITFIDSNCKCLCL